MYFEGVLGLEELEWAVLFLAAFVTVVPGLFMWVKVASKKGTRYALFIAMVCFMGTFPFVFLMTNYVAALILMLCAGVGLGGLMLFPTILLSDVIDEDQLKTGKRREGVYNGVSGIIVKLSNAISWGIIGVVLTIFGISQANLTPSLISPHQIFGFQFLIGVVPVVIILLGLLCLFLYPLHGKKLEEMKEQVFKLNEELRKGK